MLGIFQKLVASRVHDQDGFRILEALLDNLPLETLQPYLTTVRSPCDMTHFTLPLFCPSALQAAGQQLPVTARNVLRMRLAIADEERIQQLSTRCLGCLDTHSMGLYMSAAQIWTILFQRLQAAKTSRFVRGFLVFLSHFVVKRGPAALHASTDTVQPGIFLGILQQACPTHCVASLDEQNAFITSFPQQCLAQTGSCLAYLSQLCCSL